MDDIKENAMFKKMRIPKFNVLLTSYNYLLTDYKYLSSFAWKTIIIDEGQRLKCNETKTFKLALTLTTEYKILLSGTPL